jgi:chromosome segregation ATPase
VVSAEDRAGAQGSSGGVGTLSDDEILDALNTARAARARAEQLYMERDEAVAKLQGEVRDLMRMRDNFHSLYREERELRSEAERVTGQSREERDGLQNELILVRADLDRLNRMLERLQAQRAEQLEAVPAPTIPAIPGPPAVPAMDARVQELEREMGLLRAHAAELETAVSERTAQVAAASHRVTDLERELVMARTQVAGSEPAEDSDTVGANRRIVELESELAALRAAHEALQGGRTENAAELAAAMRRAHDLDGELASLRVEQAALRTAHERAVAARDAFKQTIAAEQAQREEAQRLSASAQQRVQDAVVREQQAVRVAQQSQAASERAEVELQAAKATIAVLEQRVHDADQARDAAEKSAAAVWEELHFVRTDVLTERTPAPATAPAAAKRTLLRRRPAESAKLGAAPRHVETIGTAVAADKTVEVAGTAEDIESALHRRMFGGQ